MPQKKVKKIWTIYKVFKDMDEEDRSVGTGHIGTFPANAKKSAPKNYFKDAAPQFQKGEWINKTIESRDEHGKLTGKVYHSWWFVPEYGNHYFQFHYLEV